MPTLYRKYRPQTFADLTDQEPIVQTITNEIIHGTVAHAYLFSGPRGIGKTTMARLLAKAVNCDQRSKDSAEPCNACGSCDGINAGRYIDVIEIDAASQTGVDNVRENIIENVQFKPTMAKYKVFIIDEAHMLSPSSFNALLKTLEEPPAHALFILATTEAHKFPATVVSRCQRFTFKKIGHDSIVKRLKKICQAEKVKVDKEVLERIAGKSEGGLRDAESLLGQILSLELSAMTLKDTEMILPTSDIGAVITFAEHLFHQETKLALELVAAQLEDGVSMDQFAYDLLETLRVTMLLQATGDLGEARANYSDTAVKRLRALAQAVPAAELVALIEAALKRRAEIKVAPLPQLPLELLAVTAPSILSARPTASSGSAIVSATATTPAPVAETTTPASGIAATIKQAIAHITHDEPLRTSLEEIKKQWPVLMEKIGVTNHSLTFILAMSTIQGLRGNHLVLTLPYSFHKEKLEEQKNKVVIENALEAVFSEKIRLACEVAQAIPAAHDVELTGFAVQFGGEVVN
ncbi:MAG: DNA polymerase III subunit gamma/tau [Candidatus Magasanikbacteria bacterium]|nr:DNA polymerase III subunit gamma/tau [Candidatus Magasanikbacteria bacterium]